MLKTKQFWIGIAVSAFFLALFLYRIDYPKTGEALKDANYIYLVPAIAVYFSSVWFRTLRWQYLLKHLRWAPMGRLYPVVVVGYMANNVLPMRLGEVVRSYYVAQREKISAVSALATTGIDRVFDGITLIFFVLVIWPFLPLGEFFRSDSGDLLFLRVLGSATVIAIFFGAILVFVAVAVRPSLGRKLTDLIVFFVPGRFKAGVQRLAELFIGGLESLNSPRKLLAIFILSIPVWMTETLMYYTITFSFGLDVSFPMIMLVTAVSNLVGALPAAPGNVGTLEWSMKITLVSFGFDTEATVAYAATLHVALWLPVVIAGIVYLWTQHRSLLDLARRGPEMNWADGNPGDALPIEGKSDK